jgi:hypothetical protein
VLARPWFGSLPAADIPIPQNIMGERYPELAAAAPQELPAAPVVVLRAARVRGQSVAVLGISPLYRVAGQPMRATTIAATVPGALPLTAGQPDVAAQVLAQFGSSAPFLSAPGPANPLALSSAPVFTIEVSSGGMQQISAPALAAAGLALDQLDPARLHLWHGGLPVALEARGTADGSLDPEDILRFYAPPPGDRWNSTDTYWLAVQEEPGLRMHPDTSAVLTNTFSTQRTTAHTYGTWRDNQVYESTLPGPDGDHWFHADLRSGPGLDPASVGLTLTPAAALSSGSATLTVDGAAFTRGPHTLRVELAHQAQRVTWEGTGNFSHVMTYTADLAGLDAVDVTVSLLSGAAPSGIKFDGLGWELPIDLDARQAGLSFGSTAPVSYTLRGIAPGSTLYDIRDPAAPRPLLPGAATDAPRLTFSDMAGNGRYLLAVPHTLHHPSITAHTPLSITAALDADVLMIAPALLHEALTPLVEHRRAQGYTVEVVNSAALYDAWSYGQIDPVVVRDFLRYAASTGKRAPHAALLVGDGTSDPLNYTGRDATNFIPPYLAMVDPWLGETACDTCLAQLDGDDPLEDTLPDLALGRLPVKSVAELETVIEKILTYERAGGGGWSSQMTFLADNYIQPDTGLPDQAGDFAALSDAIAALQPPGIQITRMYYDPSSTGSASAWREPDAAQARLRAMEAFNAGAGILTYTGHSHHWQWATTDRALEQPSLMSLYDADQLTNGERLPIVLSMTCLTSSFYYPAYSGTTIDERILLHRGGGGVAVWGPTGLGVLYGHDKLQQGFYRELWHAQTPAPLQGTLGTLVQAGYLRLFTEGTCCQSSLHTFVLLGDPLTQPQVELRLMLPLVLA